MRSLTTSISSAGSFAICFSTDGLIVAGDQFTNSWNGFRLQQCWLQSVSWNSDAFSFGPMTFVVGATAASVGEH